MNENVSKGGREETRKMNENVDDFSNKVEELIRFLAGLKAGLLLSPSGRGFTLQQMPSSPVPARVIEAIRAHQGEIVSYLRGKAGLEREQRVETEGEGVEAKSVQEAIPDVHPDPIIFTDSSFLSQVSALSLQAFAQANAVLELTSPLISDGKDGSRIPLYFTSTAAQRDHLTAQGHLAFDAAELAVLVEQARRDSTASISDVLLPILEAKRVFRATVMDWKNEQPESSISPEDSISGMPHPSTLPRRACTIQPSVESIYPQINRRDARALPEGIR